MMKLDDILKIAISKGASDIHLTNGRKPTLRVDGVLLEIEDGPINNPEYLTTYTNAILSIDEAEAYQIKKSIDSSMSYLTTRFRIHIYKQKECDCIVLRLIPTSIPTLEEINLPDTLRKFSSMRSGLVIVTGVTGSGKSTTLASIISDINSKYAKNIITVEQPIEFIHSHNKSIINQREIGIDVTTFSSAVIDAMRADPDILLIGEMRDLDTITNAITMAETGHLVFGTLHTKSAPETIDRIIDVFPAGQQSQIRIQLANSIVGIVSQELLPKVGGGRVPTCEIMFSTSAVRNIIRENGNPASILDDMQMNSKKMGTQTRIQSIADLLKRGLITKETVKNYIDAKDAVELNKLLMTR